MIDEATKKAATRRLSIISGQVKGLQKMIDDEKYCVDILTQLSAIQASLKGVGKVIVKRHLESCVTSGIRSETPEKHYDELMRIIYNLT